VDDYLSIASGLKKVALFLQQGTHLLEVVDFPIEDQPDLIVLVSDRLVSRFQVDDTQPAHAQPR
jgi:hypothetical protein